MPLLRGKVRQGVLKVQVRKLPRRQAKEPQVQVLKVPLQLRVLRPLNSVCAVASTATGHLNALYLPMPRRPPLVLRPSGLVKVLPTSSRPLRAFTCVLPRLVWLEARCP